MLKKTYRIARTFDWPADGPVKLGAIIANPDKPDYPLDSNEIMLPEKSVVELDKRDVQTRINNGQGVAARVFGKILSASGIDLGSSKSRSRLGTLETKRLKTRYIDPEYTNQNDSWIEKRLEDPGVQKYITTNRRKVYMITGLKIAHDASREGFEYSNHRAGPAADVDATLTGSPVEVGISAHYSRPHVRNKAFREGTDFVFAYELREVKYGVMSKTLKTRYATSGAVIDVHVEDKGLEHVETKLEGYNKGLKEYDGPDGVTVPNEEEVSGEEFILSNE